MTETESRDSPGTWLPIAEAARRLGVTPKAIRNRIQHGSIEWRTAGNRGREVLVSADMEASPGDSPGTVSLLVQVARLEERLEASGRREAELRSERDRLIGDLTEARRELADARKGWLERLLEAVRRRP